MVREKEVRPQKGREVLSTDSPIHELHPWFRLGERSIQGLTPVGVISLAFRKVQNQDHRVVEPLSSPRCNRGGKCKPKW